MTSPGEIDEARGRGDAQCEAQAGSRLVHTRKTRKVRKPMSQGTIAKKILSTEQTRGWGNDSSKISEKEYPSYSVTLHQQCNPDPSA
jgi:hypothetical protein